MFPGASIKIGEGELGSEMSSAEKSVLQEKGGNIRPESLITR